MQGLAQVARDEEDRRRSASGDFELPPEALKRMAGLKAQPYYTIAGNPHVRIPWGDEQGSRYDPDLRCPGCGSKPGELHVPTCSREQCPSCGGTAFQCDCKYGK